MRRWWPKEREGARKTRRRLELDEREGKAESAWIQATSWRRKFGSLAEEEDL